jgi:hypothetical protein
VYRLSGLENNLLGLSSRVNSVLWSRSSPDIENIDVICFGHLLFEMCAGYELTEASPTRAHLQIDLERYPQASFTFYLFSIFYLTFDLISGCGHIANDFRLTKWLSIVGRACAM